MKRRIRYLEAKDTHKLMLTLEGERMLGKILFDLGAAFSLIGLVVHIRQYRKYSSGERFPSSRKEAYEFVEHSCLSLWFALGALLIALVDVSPWWLFVWFLGGGLIAFIVERLLVVSGLRNFITAGETSMQSASFARQAEYDQVMEGPGGEEPL
jgi:hypothetical protein